MRIVNHLMSLLGLALALWAAHAHDFYSMFTGIIVMLSAESALLRGAINEAKRF